ncbi:MAG: Holliday junction resolvase RuvX [Endomicrobium sp.]|uniref:Holliday junction resolvase RuvX n=1 Tax=Candidatus Endomicrobiellum pyrsonymphae TaxID=1408203 RepID=UPI00357A1A1E|nr:Holliday junction resolvase RuvX [Endomicrobium sp.]MCA6073224.1 Holliday junction resolvase RuvX [Endomicrobium sp.]
MARLMGIDYGLKRIGIAMTDMLQITSSPFETIESVSLKKNALRLLEIAKNNDVSVIVFGLPINMNGTEGEMAYIVRKVVEEIKSLSSVEVAMIDERLTTAQAERMLINEGDVSRKKRKGLKDKIAASLILQTYMDTHS